MYIWPLSDEAPPRLSFPVLVPDPPVRSTYPLLFNDAAVTVVDWALPLVPT